VCNAVEPGPKGDVAVIGAEPRVSLHEDVLKRVFCVVPRAGHLPCVGKQALAIAVVDDPERLVVPSPEQRHQLLVGPQAKQRRADRDPMPRQSC
jgi:hypothetical protein